MVVETLGHETRYVVFVTCSTLMHHSSTYYAIRSEVGFRILFPIS
jgi:hypothetical protein